METQSTRSTLLEQTIAPRLPGYLALLNMAESKRRNLHLGFRAVDEDIAELGALLQSHLGQDGAHGRWGGDSWWAFVPRAGLPVLDVVVAAFSRSMEISAGWECRAHAADGRQSTSTDQRRVMLRRGVRCGYVAVEGRVDLEVAMAVLQAALCRLPVGKVRAIAEVEKMQGVVWESISGDIPWKWYCPFCSATQMLDGEGTDNTEEGLCAGCGAELEVLHF